MIEREENLSFFESLPWMHQDILIFGLELNFVRE